jgi:hypothetical protein
MIAYLEDAPADTGSGMRGLSKAMVPLLDCIDDGIRTYFVHQTHAQLPSEQMPSFVRAKLIEGRFQAKLSRQAWRLATVLPISLGLKLASLFTPSPNTNVSVGREAYLWVPVGIDPGTLVRAWCVARQMGIPLHLYLVDDVETHPANGEIRQLKRLIARILRDATRVYTITDELGALYNARYGIKTRRLPLIPIFHQITAAEPPTDAKHKPYFAVFLGSINHLYEDGLRHLVDSVGRLRNETGKDLQLRFFSDTVAVRRLCGGNIPSWIIAGPERDDAIVQREIETSNLCFLPYSFDEAARTMVSTSFPSKLLDYLLNARSIVVFAPDYSIAHKTLSVDCAPHVVSTPEALSDVLADLAVRSHTSHDEYRALLARQFSCNIVKQALAAPW